MAEVTQSRNDTLEILAAAQAEMEMLAGTQIGAADQAGAARRENVVLRDQLLQAQVCDDGPFIGVEAGRRIGKMV